MEIKDALELDGLRTYLEGKMKRLNLLFAVNGGAFAIATLDPDKIGGIGLPLGALAIGAIIFTIVMVADTWLWAHMMKRDCIHDRGFRWQGQLILVLLGLLIVSAWSFVWLRSPAPTPNRTFGASVNAIIILCALAGLVAMIIENKWIQRIRTWGRKPGIQH